MVDIAELTPFPTETGGYFTKMSDNQFIEEVFSKSNLARVPYNIFFEKLNNKLVA